MPDLVLMDLDMVVMDGIEATRQIKAAAPQIRVLAFTAETDTTTVSSVLEAGADGYCLKSTDVESLVMAIQTVSSGGAWLDPLIATMVQRYAAERRPKTAARQQVRVAKLSYGLSTREMEVVSLIVGGLSNAKIAEQLQLSEDTIKTHIRHIMEKLQAHGRTQIAVKAIKDGLIEFERTT